MYDKGPGSSLEKFKGKVAWVRGNQPNKYDKWSIEFYPERESLDRIRDLQAEGVKNVIKKNDDNEYHLQISRPVQIEFRKGVKEPVQPPKITYQGQPYDKPVGNGTDGTVICEVYTHRVPNSEKRAKAMRWYGLDIDNLVPFDIPEEQPSEPKQEAIW